MRADRRDSGLLTAETIHFAEELFVIAGRDFFLSMVRLRFHPMSPPSLRIRNLLRHYSSDALQKNKEEEGLFLAVLKRHATVPECATLMQVLLPLRH